MLEAASKGGGGGVPEGFPDMLEPASQGDPEGFHEMLDPARQGGPRGFP